MIKSYLQIFSKVVMNTTITDKYSKEIEHEEAYKIIISQLIKLKNKKGTLFLIGNGGSSGIISHASIDFLNTSKIKAFPLTDDCQLTCIANDYGYENVFKIPLEIMFTSRDGLIAVSSSGSSKNIVNATHAAKDIGGLVITFSGFDRANPLRKIGDINFWLDSMDYGKVEIGHALLLHILTYELQNSLIKKKN